MVDNLGVLGFALRSILTARLADAKRLACQGDAQTALCRRYFGKPLALKWLCCSFRESSSEGRFYSRASTSPRQSTVLMLKIRHLVHQGGVYAAAHWTPFANAGVADAMLRSKGKHQHATLDQTQHGYAFGLIKSAQ